MDIDTAIMFAFIFDLTNMHRSNFTGSLHMGATARLEIDTADANQPYLTGTVGGCTDMVRTRSGFAASSASLIDEILTA